MQSRPSTSSAASDDSPESFELVGSDSRPAPRRAARPRKAKPKLSTAMVPTATVEVLTKADEDALLEMVPTPEVTRLYLQNELEARQHYDRSRELFEERVPITAVDNELLLKKVAERVRYVHPPKLLQRQLHNALLFAAKPFMATQDTFSVTLDYLMWSVEHNHNDYAYLKESLEGMQRTLMQISLGEKWFSTQILQDIYVDGTTLYYKIPPLLRKLASAPERYYHISMHMNARFRSKYALALYELLRQNLYRKQTGEMSIEEFRDHMGVAKDEYPEFKRLNARVLMPALAELDEVSDYRAIVKYRTMGRRVVALNFHIEENPKNFIPLHQDGALDVEHYTLLREEFGISAPQIRELTRTHGFRRVEEITDVLYYRYILQKRKVRKGLSLVTSALADEADKYFLTNTEKAELAVAKEQRRKAREQSEAERALEDQRKSTRVKLFAWWDGLTPEQQGQAWDAFVADPENASVVRLCKLRRGEPRLSTPMVTANFQAFVLKHGISLDA